jgi:hypothetical protein
MTGGTVLVIVLGGIMTDVAGGGAGAGAGIGAGAGAGAVVVVKPWVPEIVTAARETEDWSATRFHFLKGIGKGRGWIRKGILPELGSAGTRILPVLVTLTRLENLVVVVVNTLSVERETAIDETTSETVGNDVVRTALVMVVIGNEPVRAGAAKTEILLPSGTVGDPFSEVTNGLSPPRMLKGPELARIAVGLFTIVQWIWALFLNQRRGKVVPHSEDLRKDDLTGWDGDWNQW